MKSEIYVSKHDGMDFKIDVDPYVGAYLYIWKDGVGLGDYLQDTVEICKEFALEDYGVPLDSWLKVDG